MVNEKEVTALLTLIEDPDTEVFEAVSNRIIAYGTPMIPRLEDLWEHTVDNQVQERIELLIHRLHFHNLKNDFRQWAESPHQELLPGALLVRGATARRNLGGARYAAQLEATNTG